MDRTDCMVLYLNDIPIRAVRFFTFLFSRHPLSLVCLRSLDRRYRRRRPVIDDSSVSERLAREPSWFWLRLPAICMTFDPSPTRAMLRRYPALDPRISSRSRSLSPIAITPVSDNLVLPLARFQDSLARDGSIYFYNSPYLFSATR